MNQETSDLIGRLMLYSTQPGPAEHRSAMALAAERLAVASETRDTMRLDFLEEDIDGDPLLLFQDAPRNGNQGFRGLGLRATGRTLREALDALMHVHGVYEKDHK